MRHKAPPSSADPIPRWTEQQVVFIEHYLRSRDKYAAAAFAYPQAKQPSEAFRWVEMSHDMRDWLYQQEHPSEMKCTKEYLLTNLLEVVENGRGAARIHAVALAAKMMGYSVKPRRNKPNEEKPEIPEELAKRLEEAVN